TSAIWCPPSFALHRGIDCRRVILRLDRYIKHENSDFCADFSCYNTPQSRMAWPMAACRSDSVVMQPLLTFCCTSMGTAMTFLITPPPPVGRSHMVPVDSPQ